MSTLIYTAISEDGVCTQGECIGKNESELRQELTEKGLFVQTIQKKNTFSFSFSRKKFKPDLFLIVNQEFTALIKAGLTIPEALRLVSDRPDQAAISQILKRVLSDVQGGSLLSDACARHPNFFDGLYIAAIKTGEKTGDLISVLQRYQTYLKQWVSLQKKVSQALSYPIFLLITLVIILGLLFVFVMPRFVDMYADFGVDLPLATRIIINLVTYFPQYGPVVGSGIAIGFVMWKAWVATEAGRLSVDLMKEKIPLVGIIYRDVGIAQISRTLSTLLAGGATLVESLQTIQESVKNQANQVRLKKTVQLIKEGKSLAVSMSETGLVPKTAVKMIEVGENSGGLEEMLAEVATYYEGVLSNKIARMTALIEPILMLLMGILVGGTIIVMYLPMFYIVDVIK